MTMPGRYILDEHGEPQPCDDLLTWGRWMQTAERHLAYDKDEGPNALEIRISTVFLGLDHSWGDGPPALWETMVFGGVLDGEMDRYTSKADALRGHHAMCRRVRATLERSPAVDAVGLSVGKRGDLPAVDATPYHQHLDICTQCREQPFNQCDTGARLLREAVDASDRP